MKKIITLFTAALLIAGFTYAQTPEDARDVILGKKKRTEQGKEDPGDILGNRRSDDRDAGYPSGSAEAERERINREYDYKIQTIRNNNALSAEEKRKMIDYLNKEREKELRSVRNDGRRDNDRDDNYKKSKKNKEYKSNRGKHKGWQKGKGNKHRNRDDD